MVKVRMGWGTLQQRTEFTVPLLPWCHASMPSPLQPYHTPTPSSLEVWPSLCSAKVGFTTFVLHAVISPHTDIARVLPAEGSLLACRTRVLEMLTQVLLGDSLAAEYTLLHLLSSVYVPLQHAHVAAVVPSACCLLVAMVVWK